MALLDEIRRESDKSGFPSVVAELDRNPLFRKLAFGEAFPRAGSGIGKGLRFTQVPVDREFAWAAARLVSRSAELLDLVEVSSSIDKDLLVQDWAAARKHAEDLREKHGLSLMLIGRLIYLTQMTDGLEAQKRLVNQLQGNLRRATISNFITYQFSVRCEPSVDYARFQERTARDIADAKFDDQFSGFLLTSIIPDYHVSLRQLTGSLCFAGSMSIFDLYDRFLSSARRVIASHAEFAPDIVESLRSVSAAVPDERLARLRRVAEDIEAEAEYSESVIRCHDSYLVAAGPKAPECDSASIPLPSYDAVACTAHAHSRALDSVALTPSGRERDLASMLAEMTACATGSRKTLTELRRASACLHGTALASVIDYHAALLTYRSQSELVPELRFCAAGSIGPVGPISALSEPPNRRRAIASAAGRVGATGVRWVAELPDVLSAQTTESAESCCVLTADETDLCICIASSGLGPSMERAARRLAGSASPFYRHFGARALARYLLGTGRLAECIFVVGSELAESTDRAPSLPVAELVAAIGEAGILELASSPHLSIVMDVYSREISQDRDAHRVDACEDFLGAVGVRRPSQALSALAKYTVPTEVYFLRNVCSETVLSRLPDLRNSVEVARERLELCRSLLDLDPGSRDAYHAEIRSISQALALRQKMLQIEDSKVYVNSEGIRRSFQSSVKDAFERYVAHVSNGVGLVDVASVDQTLVDVAAGNTEGLRRLAIPASEPGALFRSTVLAFRDEYALGAAHGLDGYLSVRIRHGALEGQLRRPFEAAHLLVPVDREAGVSLRSEYWRARYAHDPDLAQAIDAHLGRFTMAVNAIVDEVSGAWVQVRTDKTSPGEFDFSVGGVELALIARQVDRVYTLDEFTDKLNNWFEAALLKNLESMRRRIHVELKPRITNLIVTLEGEVGRAISGRAVDLLDAIRTAKTEAQRAVERLEQWFVRERVVSKEAFTFEQAVRIAESSVQAIRPEFRVNCGVEASVLTIPSGLLLTPMHDILFTVFENVVRHSGLQDHVGCDVGIAELESGLEIEISNKLHASYRVDAAQARLEEVRSRIAAGHPMPLVSREGGSGFHKLQKLLTHDLGCEPDLKFWIAEDRRFVVRFRLPTQPEVHDEEGI